MTTTELCTDIHLEFCLHHRIMSIYFFSTFSIIILSHFFPMAKMLWNIFSARHPSIGAPIHLLVMAMCDNSVCVCYARKRRWTKKKNHTTKYPCILCSIHLAYQLVPFGDNGEWDARESRPTARIGRARSMSARIDQRTEFWNGICWTWIEFG